MGTPQNIYKLAENFIVSKGLIPHDQYKIKIVGVGSGEKINEQLYSDNEEPEKTEDDKILILKSKINSKIKDQIKKDFKDPLMLSKVDIINLFNKYSI